MRGIQIRPLLYTRFKCRHYTARSLLCSKNLIKCLMMVSCHGNKPLKNTHLLTRITECLITPFHISFYRSARFSKGYCGMLQPSFWCIRWSQWEKQARPSSQVVVWNNKFSNLLWLSPRMSASNSTFIKFGVKNFANGQVMMRQRWGRTFAQLF